MRRGAQAPAYGASSGNIPSFDKLRIGAAKIGKRRESQELRRQKFVKPVLDFKVQQAIKH